VLRLDFGIEDVASVRFAISPMAETIGALRVLGDPDRSRPHQAWLSGLGELHAGEWLGLLLALVPADGYLPDFLTPPLTVPIGEIDAELATIRATAPDIVQRELALTYAGRTMPAPISALHTDPATRLTEIVNAIARWYAIAIAPYWERLQAVLTAEIARQSRRLTDAGPRLALSNLHPSIRWHPGHLTVDMRWDARVLLDGKGLLLVPSAFWQDVGPIVLGSWQPTLLYPCTGAELIWQTEQVRPNALAGVLGATRARLLIELEEPATTSQLARRLGLAAPGVSQHLQHLRSARLVAAARDGREVRYQRTPLAAELVRAATSPG
jgi:DNA-binding transcriptional ArsR family regulator